MVSGKIQDDKATKAERQDWVSWTTWTGAPQAQERMLDFPGGYTPGQGQANSFWKQGAPRVTRPGCRTQCAQVPLEQCLIQDTQLVQHNGPTPLGAAVSTHHWSTSSSVFEHVYTELRASSQKHRTSAGGGRYEVMDQSVTATAACQHCRGRLGPSLQ